MTAIRIGISIRDYDDLSPYQLGLIVQDFNERKQEELRLKEIEIDEKLRVTYLAALWTSRFVWQKKPPSYEKLMEQNKPKKVMTPEEILEEVKSLNASLGGTFY